MGRDRPLLLSSEKCLRSMKRRTRLILLQALGLITVMLGAGRWFVFVRRSTQLDPPQTNQPHTGMCFKLEVFASESMHQNRTYGLISPPGYEGNPTRHYPVIVLLHGGHDDARA